MSTPSTAAATTTLAEHSWSQLSDDYDDCADAFELAILEVGGKFYLELNCNGDRGRLQVENPGTDFDAARLEFAEEQEWAVDPSCTRSATDVAEELRLTPVQPLDFATGL